MGQVLAIAAAFGGTGAAVATAEAAAVGVELGADVGMGILAAEGAGVGAAAATEVGAGIGAGAAAGVGGGAVYAGLGALEIETAAAITESELVSLLGGAAAAAPAGVALPALFAPVLGATTASALTLTTAAVLLQPVSAMPVDQNTDQRNAHITALIATIDQADAADMTNNDEVDLHTYRDLLTLRLARMAIRDELEQMRKGKTGLTDVSGWQRQLVENLQQREKIYTQWQQTQAELRAHAQVQKVVNIALETAFNELIGLNMPIEQIDSLPDLDRLQRIIENQPEAGEAMLTANLIHQINVEPVREFASQNRDQSIAAVHLIIQKKLAEIEQRRAQLQVPQPPVPPPPTNPNEPQAPPEAPTPPEPTPPPPQPPPPDPEAPTDAGKPQTQNTTLTHDADPNATTNSSNVSLTPEAAERGGSMPLNLSNRTNSTVDDPPLNQTPFFRWQRRQRRRERRENRNATITNTTNATGITNSTNSTSTTNATNSTNTTQQPFIDDIDYDDDEWYYDDPSKRPDPQPSFDNFAFNGSQSIFSTFTFNDPPPMRYNMQTYQVSWWEQLMNFFYQLFRWPR